MPRLMAGVASLAVMLVLVACTDDPPSVTGEGATTAVTTGEPISLRYGLEDGDELVYDVDLEQSLVLETSGSATAVAEEEIPATADVTIDATGVFTYRVAEGPEEGTLAVAIEGEFSDVAVEGTVDGEPVDDVEEVGQFGVAAPVSRTVVIDPRGRVVPDTTTGSDPLGLGSLPLAGLAGDLGRVVGPALPEGEVTPGESWTVTSQQAAFGDETIETTVTASVTGTDQIDGREAVVIDATTETGPLVVDLSEFFAGFMGAFDDPAEVTEDIVFRIDVEPSTSESTTAFDPDEGVAIRSTVEGPSALSMEVALPDDATGEVQSFDVSLDVEQAITYALR